MYDIDIGVCQLAVRFLEEVCEDVATLQMVVEMQPTFQHLGEMAHPLLMK
jgi:rapamycin-insensitive companion of mTOR